MKIEARTLVGVVIFAALAFAIIALIVWIPPAH